MADAPRDGDWSPARMPSRPADLTENIHRAIAIFYGLVIAMLVVVQASAGRASAGAIAGTAIFLGALLGLHAVLAFGARRRSGLAKAGSIVVGGVMLLFIPVGTLVGGMLIYNAVQSWPPRRQPWPEPAGADLRELR